MERTASRPTARGGIKSIETRLKNRLRFFNRFSRCEERPFSPYLILLAVIGFLAVVVVFLSLEKSSRTAKKPEREERKAKVPCPLCGSRLFSGERDPLGRLRPGPGKAHAYLRLPLLRAAGLARPAALPGVQEGYSRRRVCRGPDVGQGRETPSAHRRVHDVQASVQNGRA